MKQFYHLIIFLSIGLYSIAQPPVTARINNLKDAWDLKVSYIGQVKNGKPDGLGQFIYYNGYALRHVGYFANGLPKGKGVLLMSDGSFLCGDWDQGKLNGKGANLNNNGHLYFGGFKNGMRHGKGVLVYEENNFVIGDFARDILNGRAVFLEGNAKTISENVYIDDERNGPGYQYDVDNKKLYKGNWADNKWVGAGDVPFTSFLADTRFKGQETTSRVLMGSVNKDGNLQDTGFYYDRSNFKRYFGAFDQGKLKYGLIIRNDSSVIFGHFNDKGAHGFCHLLKRGKYYNEGMFENDYLSGPANMSIDLVKHAVYYGQTLGNGAFTGKAWFAASNNALYNGDYQLGKFTGNGWKLDSNGYCTGGVWMNGVLQKISFLTQPNGQAMNTAPATLNETLKQSLLLYEVNFRPIFGRSNADKMFMSFDECFETPYKMLPAAKGSFAVAFEKAFVQFAIVEEITDPKAAAARYTSLCKQIAAATIATGKPGVALKLTTTNKFAPEDPKAGITTFSLSQNTNPKWCDFKVMAVQFFDNDENKYYVLLAAGASRAIHNWLSKIGGRF